ncbi:hypothetical protein C8J57DRAFT_1121367 [Mycena rebaudengoi]|nr:hypothetical protein C8J57DRAFT_1121367 [Mycena rebaudengoi]
MRLEGLFARELDANGCIICPTNPSCNCATGQTCVFINRNCDVCPAVRCITAQTKTNSSSSGVSKGALAGAVIGSLIFLAIAVCAVLWYRRRLRLRTDVTREVKDVPASAETVLNRPDPTEKPPTPPVQLGAHIVRVYSSSNRTIDLDPQSHTSPLHSPSRQSTQSNPFSDSNSIQTAGTESTNVIPIALVAPESHRSVAETASTGPVRPVRSPELNLDHVNVSRDSIKPSGLYAPSQRSGVSGVSSRNSYMSNASFASEFMNEAPMIITPVKGSVRVVKAEVINAGALSPTTSEGSRQSRPPVGSPLASRSFGPADVVKEEHENDDSNPFRDGSSSPSASVTTFGHASVAHHSTGSDWVPDEPTLPWARSGNDSRPSSMSTQAGSVIDIGSATRVNVGYATPVTAGFPRSPFRTTMGRLVTPNTANNASLEEQQQRALDHAQARAHAQGGDLPNRRISDSSVMTSASRADSILESFPFVPPSPISDRPMRSPPVSPLGQQTFSSAAPSPTNAEFANKARAAADSDLPAPPNRRTLGLSTASQFSTASSGLGAFPFQIDSGRESANPPTAFNNNVNGRQRASLDTLALTSDLSSYPLGFDRESVAAYPKI